MMLTTQQKQDFFNNGFVQIPGAVAPEMVERAVQTINYRLGQGFDSAELRKFQSQSFFPDLQTQPLVTDLFNASGVRDRMEELLGAGNVAPSTSGQLALRFPQPVGTPPRAPGPHIDGLHSPDNGVPKGTLGSFTALVGVFLTDVTRDAAGNFAVWPGSHRKMETYFRENGIEALLNDGQTPRLDYGEPLQIHARAGDAVLAHYQLLHGITLNTAPFPRYAAFFRVKHPQHQEHRLECLTDLWREWPGMQDIVD